jgi:hypothetical protein
MADWLHADGAAGAGFARAAGDIELQTDGTLVATGEGIGRRMKQTGAQWRVRRAKRMAVLCCALPGDTGPSYREHRFN